MHLLAADQGPVRTSSLLFAYWGRRGAGPTLTEAMVRAAQQDPALTVSLSFARQGERSNDLLALTPEPLVIDSFDSALGALAATARLPALHRQLTSAIKARGVDWVITVMPHLWGRLLASAAHRAGARYAVIVHDAQAHPGEESWLLDRLATAEIKAADRVIACSAHVARALKSRHGALPLTTLFHPPFDFGTTTAPTPRERPRQPLRLLFFGRLLPYKGLPLLLKAHRLLRTQGLDCALSIVGDGATEGLTLDTPDVTLVNRWIAEPEIPGVLAEADILVAPYVEASQSGVIAAALAAGLPVVATPVGGLVEQVFPGQTGIVADAVTAEAVADAIRALASPDLYARCSAGALAQAREAGWPAFIRKLTAALTADD
jgi:glycosyltransferase involved in cell wall biosynthesis